MTDSQKRKAALDAIDRYRKYAADNAVTIANNAVSLFRASEDERGDYPELAEYMRLRNHADEMVREVLP
jgi:hypothetical protein